MTEIWKDIEGYEGLYQVSNFGRVKSLERKAKTKNDSYRIVKEQLLKQTLSNTGYFRVVLYKDGQSKNHSVHRLVATAFIPNPNNYPFVNHKSEVKTENFVENLEWCTQSYNTRYGSAIERQVKTQMLTMPTNKSVAMYTTDNEFIRTYISISAASRDTGISIACISNSCNKQITHPRGKYIFRFVA